ncbi:MAG: class I SAM-dependent methyltransferase [Methylacidiphilales bacterium]|nr:class I SAM-dependent methyltransferase [Candidatus Methylacidiphilales bacterium]
MRQEIPPPAVSSGAYTREYFEHWCNGAHEFRISRGKKLPIRLIIALKLANIRGGEHVLDVGCGRGELAVHCALRGAWVWGIDYSSAALEFATEAISNTDSETRKRIQLIRADARFIPIQDQSIDVSFMIDVVEHLKPNELDWALQEIRRVLRPGGRLIVHTMPNLWYYSLGYPIYRAVQALRGIHLPVNPRDRWPFKEVHVNEQTPFSLQRALIKNGFQTKILLKNTQSFEQERNIILKTGMHLLVNAPLIKLFFCNDIFAIAKKRVEYRR